MAATVTEKLLTTTMGDEVYRYQKSIVVFFKGKRKVLSTSIYNGGYHEDYTAVYNNDCTQGSGMPCLMLADTYNEHMRLRSKSLGLNPDAVTGMGTAAQMENVAIVSESYKELKVTAIVTGGIETNGGRVGDPSDYYHPIPKDLKPGTINIMLLLDADMPPGTLTRALVTCTEAKTAAIQELLAGSNYSTGLATGSGTDQTIIVANRDSSLYLEGSGKHSKMGELIGKAVMQAVKVALKKQSGLSPASQLDAIRRLKRYGVSEDKLWDMYEKAAEKDANPSEAAKANEAAETDKGAVEGKRLKASTAADKVLLKPEFLTQLNAITKDPQVVSLVSLYAHLLDQHSWGLLDEDTVLQSVTGVLGLLNEYLQLPKATYSLKEIKDCIPVMEKLLVQGVKD